MGTATQPTTFSDFRTAFLNAAREATGVSGTNTIADRYLNSALHDFFTNWDLPWAIRRAVLITQPRYTTGTMSVSQGGTTVTGVSTLWNTANVFAVNNARAGGKIVLGSVSDGVYEVSSVTNDTALVITSRFTGSDLAAGSSYIYFEDEYALASDFFRSAHPKEFGNNLPVPIIDRQEFTRRYPRNDITGRPRIATIIDLAPSGSTARNQRIVFHPSPDLAYKIDYDYQTTNLAISSAGTAQVQMPADTDEPIIPLRYRHVLLLHALVHWYRDRKDDSERAQLTKGEFVDLMKRIAGDVTTATPRPRLAPRTSHYFASRSPRGRRYDINSEFDQLLR